MFSELFPQTSTEWNEATAVNKRAKNLYNLDLAQCVKGSSNQAHGSVSLVSLCVCLKFGSWDKAD